MIIKVLGTKGCYNCEELYNKLINIVNEKKLNIEVEKVTSILEISKYNIKEIPGLVIDDKIIFEGLVPSKNDLIKLLTKGSIDEDIQNEKICCRDGKCDF